MNRLADGDARCGMLGLAGRFLVAVSLLLLLFATPALSPARAQNATDVQGTSARSEFWEEIRQGKEGSVSIPDAKAGRLIQSEGDVWRAWRNGPVSTYGAQGLVAVVLVLAAFFLIRGRLRIAGGWSGWTILRFNSLERTAHWLLAGSFIVLGLTGLNVLYGRYAILPLIGANAFSAITIWGKLLHNYVAFAFIAGLILTLVLWVRDNVPRRIDATWFAKGGGLVGSAHPAAGKFNGGQKMLFWLVIFFGGSVALTGLSLIFPFQIPLFAKTFALLSAVGFNLPENLTSIQEMQLAQLWHNIVSLVLLAVIIAHIYIGSLGMQGAFDAMGTGRVDLNWAREHHSLWVAELEQNGTLDKEPAQQPAKGQTQAAE
ncbi:MAG TPA: formate dehydrogenase subunit gamma [Hyphomicrobiales bacterium]|nr:formate dehydrogenase subunit gamma [Hyphomicrobiales bacterium]